ncbi:MAG: hypothetical protein V4737_17415 [Curtobacterium sp.]
MATFEQRPPRIEAEFYDGTNAADIADKVGGTVGPDGTLLAAIYGPGSSAEVWYPSYVWQVQGETLAQDKDVFEAIWKAV